MHRIRTLLLAAAVAAVLPCALADGSAPIDPCASAAANEHLAANATKAGVISLHFFNAMGARVTYLECAGRRSRRLGSAVNAPGIPDHVPTILEDAATWSCDRLVRRFVATATLPGGAPAFGAFAVRTPSCAQRFRVDVPRRVAAGSTVRIRVIDRWGIGGIRPRLCVAPPRTARGCRTLAFPRAVGVVTRRVRAVAAGRWTVELQVRGHRVRTAVAVGGGPPAAPVQAPPTVLATGDSTMQGIDSFLTDELGAATDVRSDVRPATGISRGVFWNTLAAAQAARLRPRVTVISVGAATDANPIAGAVCCGEPWIARYARRARRMMHSYLRAGRGRVFWLTPPVPRHPPRRLITDAINAAIVRAGGGLRGVTVVRVDRLVAPDGVYTDVIRHQGRDVRVREADGIHLNVAGTAIVARALARTIRSYFSASSGTT